jgi:hypothetical protein
MSDLLDTFQQRHQEKLGQLKRGEVDEAFLDGVHALITDMQQAGTVIADPVQRGQLRALMRFWGNVVYDHTGIYPDTMLQPLDLTKARPPEEPSRRPLPPLTWVLTGGAAVILITVGLVAIGWMSRFHDGAAPTPMPTPAPVPYVSRVAVGTEVDADSTLQSEADTFCMGIPEIVAEFAMAGIEPETAWHWEVQREGEGVAAQPATPWGRDAQQTIRILSGGPGGVEPGQYVLLIYVGEHVVGTHSFQVLDTVPRVFNLRVADVPEPPEEGPDGPDKARFEAGVRVIYLNYEHEGLCPDLDLSYTLYHEQEPIQENVETWSGAPQGRTRVSFQAPGNLPFSPGDYEVVVAVTGEEQARVGLTVGEEAPEEIVPAFGGLTIALGAEPDGTPILTALDNRFDWNTKAIYTIFDYVGMNEDLRWSAVWMREGQEVTREEHFWDMEADGPAGTRWVTYHDERGVVLPGGTYSVTLTIENVVQRTAGFSILYYVPSE